MSPISSDNDSINLNLPETKDPPLKFKEFKKMNQPIKKEIKIDEKYNPPVQPPSEFQKQVEQLQTEGTAVAVAKKKKKKKKRKKGSKGDNEMFRKTVYFDGSDQPMEMEKQQPKGKTAINFYNFEQEGFKEDKEDDGFYPDKSTGGKPAYIGDNPQYKANFSDRISPQKQTTGLIGNDDEIAQAIAKHKAEKWKNPTAKIKLNPAKIKLYANKLQI